MVRVQSVGEAEAGDFINHMGKISIISSIQFKGEYSIIELREGGYIVAFKDQKTEIFRVKSSSK